MKKNTASLKGVTVAPTFDLQKLAGVIERLMRETNGCNGEATACIGVLDGRQIQLSVVTDAHAFRKSTHDRCITFTKKNPS